MRKLHTASLSDALRNMDVGETCIAPDGHTDGYIRRACAGMASEGYIFQTSTRTGEMTITRLK